MLDLLRPTNTHISTRTSSWDAYECYCTLRQLVGFLLSLLLLTHSSLVILQRCVSVVVFPSIGDIRVSFLCDIFII